MTMTACNCEDAVLSNSPLPCRPACRYALPLSHAHLQVGLCALSLLHSLADAHSASLHRQRKVALVQGQAAAAAAAVGTGERAEDQEGGERVVGEEVVDNGASKLGNEERSDKATVEGGGDGIEGNAGIETSSTARTCGTKGEREDDGSGEEEEEEVVVPMPRVVRILAGPRCLPHIAQVGLGQPACMPHITPSGCLLAIDCDAVQVKPCRVFHVIVLLRASVHMLLL